MGQLEKHRHGTGTNEHEEGMVSAMSPCTYMCVCKIHVRENIAAEEQVSLVYIISAEFLDTYKEIKVVNSGVINLYMQQRMLKFMLQESEN